MLEVTLGVGIVAVLVLLLQPLTAKFFKRKWRYWVWLVLAIRLLVPINLSLPSVVEVELPRNEIVVTETIPQTPVTPPETQYVPITPFDPQDTPVVEPIDRPVYVRPVTTVKNENEKTIPITLVLATAWIVVGTAVFLYQIVTHFLFFKRTNRFNHTVTDAETLDTLTRISAEMGIKKEVKLFYNGKIQSPLLVGFFKPRVLLPKFPSKPQDLEMILRHELMHFKRHDIWYKLLVRAALSMHWFNPIVWVMAKVADEDLERACDEDVVKNQNENFRHTYCESILHVVRMQKSREPALAAGFASRPSELKKRFVRILDMTRRRGGKAALIVVACITVACTVFIGCELGGVIDVSSNIGPSDTSSQPDETSPYDVEVLVKKALEKTISEDEELMNHLKKEIGSGYVSSEAILEDVRLIESDSEYGPAVEPEHRSQIAKTSLFVVYKTTGKKLVLMESEFSYNSKNGKLSSQTVEFISFYMMDLDDSFSVQDLKGAELIFVENTRTCGVYLPSRDSMLCGLDYFKLVEIKNVDKNNPLITAYRIGTFGTNSEDIAGNEMSEDDAFVAVKNLKGDIYLAYYEAQSCTLKKLSDYQMTSIYSSTHNMGGGRVATSFMDAVAIYDFTADDPYTPIALITNEDIGVEHFEPMWSSVSDRKDDKRFLMIFKNEDSNLGFMTFDYDGNLSHCFVTDLPIVTTNDVYPPSFVGNIAYFTHNSDDYLKRVYRKYAVDVRKGKNNTPQMYEEGFATEVNVAPDEFRYDLSANAYPFILDGYERIVADTDTFTATGYKDADMKPYYYFSKVSYDAETERVEAYVKSYRKIERPYIKGRLSIESDGVYLIPYNLDDIPIPAKTNTGFVRIQIDTNDLAGLKEYALSFDKENVVIGIEAMKITRENGELSYLAEIREIFNGEYDYVTRKNKELEILNLYTAVSDGAYEITPSKYSAFESYINAPKVFFAQLSPVRYENFKDTQALLDWYVMHENRDQVDFDSPYNTWQKLSKEWTFDAEELEKTVTEYFDVTTELLRESDFYDPNAKTYTYTPTPAVYLINVDLLGSVQNGNVMQISFAVEDLQIRYSLTVQLDGDSFRFVDARLTDAFEIPSVLVTNLVPER